MALTAGTKLGPYEILTPIGAGGMGQVWRARDPRLNREVAIKISAGDFSAHFAREARAIAALNHPHVCQIYDVGPNYLVMELVAGETLAARLKRGPLAVHEAVRYGAQIADAVAAAHARKVVHRDLKPANVMIGKSGVKVVDFGLAKSLQDETQTLTLSNAVLGTPAYMAPEQREGAECDARTDIYALGLVLYEMTTGQRIRSLEQPVLDEIPAPLRPIIKGCLERDPDHRRQAAFDVFKQLTESEEIAAAAPDRTRSPRLPLAIAGLASAGLIAALFPLLHRETQPSDVLPSEFTISLEQDVNDVSIVPTPSPDGRFMVFPGQAPDGSSVLWLRPLGSLEARRLAGTEGTDGAVIWSPDGKGIAFHADGKLKKTSPSGGVPQTIAELQAFQDATWGPQGDIVFRPTNRQPLFRIRDTGGPVQPLTTLNRALTENSHRYPRFLDDGRHFLFVARCGERANNALYIGSLDSKAVRRITRAEAQFFYVPANSGRLSALLFYRDGGVWTQRFDSATYKLSGEAMPVIDSVSYNAPSVQAGFAVSRDGRLIVFDSAGANLSRLVWFRRNGEEAGSVGPPGDYIQPRISPAGDRVAYAQPDPQTGNRDIWFTEFARGITTRLTTHVANDWFPVWSPDGRQILFGSDREGGTAILAYLKTSLDGPSPESRFGVVGQPYDWSRDGRWISYGDLDISIAPAAGGAPPILFLKTPAWEANGRFSPDSKWIAYTSNQSGHFEVYARRFDGGPAAPSGKVQISDRGGEFPVWGPGEKELYFMSTRGEIYAADTTLLGRSDTIPSPKRLFRACPDTQPQSLPGTGAPYSYPFDTQDGQRFLVACRVEKPGKFTVLTNWRAIKSR